MHMLVHTDACTYTPLKKFTPFVMLLFMNHKVHCFAVCGMSVTFCDVSNWVLLFVVVTLASAFKSLNCFIELFLVRQEPHFCCFDKIAVVNYFAVYHA